MNIHAKFRWLAVVEATAIIFLFVQRAVSYPDPPCWSSFCPHTPTLNCLWSPFCFQVQNPNPPPSQVTYCAYPTISFTDVDSEPATVGFETKKAVNVTAVSGTKICDCTGCLWNWSGIINHVSWQTVYGTSPSSGDICVGQCAGINIATFTPSQAGQLPIRFNAYISGTDPDLTPPNGPASFLTSVPVLQPMRLGYWRFNDSYIGEDGQQPTGTAFVQIDPDWNDGAVEVDTAAPSGPALKYRAIELDGHPNVTHNVGTIRFWFKPNWDSGVAALPRKLFELGDLAVQIGNDGNTLQFVAGPGLSVDPVSLSSPITWTHNEWHQVVVTYSAEPANSCVLYVDGQAVASGGPMPWRQGGGTMCIGHGLSQPASNQARGWFDELETFNYPLTPEEIQENHDTARNLDTDNDGLHNIPEVQVWGTDPNNPDTDGDGVLDGPDCAKLDPNRWDCDDTTDTTAPNITLLQPVSAVPIP